MRLALPAAAVIALHGCVMPPRASYVPSTDTETLGVIRLGANMRYVIDPRTETCLLVESSPSSAWSAPVSCAKLKAKVPEAGRFITWDERAERAPGR